jgi:hypothetical protein
MCICIEVEARLQAVARARGPLRTPVVEVLDKMFTDTGASLGAAMQASRYEAMDLRAVRAPLPSARSRFSDGMAARPGSMLG